MKAISPTNLPTAAPTSIMGMNNPAARVIPAEKTANTKYDPNY